MAFKPWKRVFGHQYSVIGGKSKNVLNSHGFQAMENRYSVISIQLLVENPKMY